MAGDPKLFSENDGPITLITINRPAVRNALASAAVYSPWRPP